MSNMKVSSTSLLVNGYWTCLKIPALPELNPVLTQLIDISIHHRRSQNTLICNLVLGFIEVISRDMQLSPRRDELAPFSPELPMTIGN